MDDTQNDGVVVDDAVLPEEEELELEADEEIAEDDMEEETEAVDAE